MIEIKRVSAKDVGNDSDKFYDIRLDVCLEEGELASLVQWMRDHSMPEAEEVMAVLGGEGGLDDTHSYTRNAGTCVGGEGE